MHVIKATPFVRFKYRESVKLRLIRLSYRQECTTGVVIMYKICKPTANEKVNVRPEPDFYWGKSPVNFIFTGEFRH